MKLYLSSMLLVILAIFIGCSNSHAPKNAPEHIVIVIDENTNFEQVIDSSDAPYIKSLAKEGLLLSNYHGAWHPSQPNYIALFSGATHGIKGDRCLDDTTFTSPNLGHELLDNDYSFAGYAETMPSKGFNGCFKKDSAAGTYARKHNPWVNWRGDKANNVPDSLNLPFKDFPSDYNELPTVAIVIPNLENDMHNGPDSVRIKRGDQWLKENMDDYIQWAKKHNSLFILTFDEDKFRPQNHIATIIVGDRIQAGVDSTISNHYSMLRTIEKWYKLPNAGPAKEKALSGIWNAK